MSKSTVLIKSILNNYKSNGIYRSISVLDKKSKNRILIISGIQVVLSLVDLIAIGLVGVLGSLAIRGIKSETPGDRVNAILSFFRVSSLSFQTQVAIIGLITASLLTIRTLLTIYFSRRILYFLSSKSAEVSRKILEWHLNRTLIEINEINSQQFLFSVTTGVRNIVLGVIGSFVNIITDFSLLVILFIGLFIVDKIIALASLFIFGAVGLWLFKIMKSRAQILGSKSGELAIESNQKILEVLSTYREAVVKDRRPYYVKKVGKIFHEMSAGLAEMSFMPNISKYVIETTIVISAFIICGIEFLLSTSISAIATLSIFLAAGTRIAPSILRLQQSTIAIKGSLGTARPTFELINKFTESAKVNLILKNNEVADKPFLPEVRVRNLFFKYDKNSKFELRVDELHIKKGESVAFVGMSGSGKTTLIDILLGVIPPISGEIEISGIVPSAAFRKWPGEIAYIPQEVQIIDGSIRNNIELGYPKGKYSENQILESLDQAEMRKFVENLEFGIETQLGEGGAKISGGQRQRIGIARALISNPNLLVMDEATSSLDSETELLISNSIRKLKGKTTLIIIAHRLSTIKDLDVIYYMKNGKIVANGNFHELRKKIPDFDRQAKLMGL